MKNKILILGLAVVMFASVATAGFPTIAQAAGLTQQQINAVMTLLQAFGADQSVINNVQSALTGGPVTPPTPTTWCYTFSHDLRVGSVGNDTIALLTALEKEGFSAGQGQRGVLDEALASSVVGFQEKYASEILTPNRLTRGTGFVGASTRAKLNSLYGCNVVRPPSPQPSITVLSPNGGETYKNDGSSITVNWQTNNVPSSHIIDVIRLRVYPTGYDFKQEYNLATNVLNDGQEVITIPSSIPVGAYTIEMKTYVGGILVMDSSDSYFKIIDVSQPSITVLSPNGGESWQTGSTQIIKWTSSKVPLDDGGIIYVQNTLTGETPLQRNIAVNGGSLSNYGGSLPWTVSGSVGQYRVTVCSNTLSNPAVTGKPLCDSSDSYFTITTTPTIQLPTITLSANQIATSDAQPKSYAVTWSATNANSCVLTTNATKDTEDFDFWSGYIGPVQTSGSITAQVYSGATVTITCTSSGGTSAKSVNLTGNVVSVPQPTVTLKRPNGGETFVAGQTIPSVGWTAANFPAATTIDSFAFTLISSNNATYPLTLVKNSIFTTGFNGYYNYNNSGDSSVWNMDIPSNVPAGQYKLKISCASCGAGGIQDISDSYFTIQASNTNPSLSLTSPSTNQNVVAGQPVTINWTSSNVLPTEKITILFSNSNNTTLGYWAPDTIGVPNTGSYTWTVPAGITLGKYKVQISCADCYTRTRVPTYFWGGEFNVVAPTVVQPSISISNSSSVPAQNIAVNVPSQTLGGFEVNNTSSEPISVSRMVNTIDGGGTRAITNVYLYSSDNTILAGPVDVNQYDGIFTFTDTFVLPVGRNTFVIKGRIGSQVVNNQTFNVRINPASWTMRGQQSGSLVSAPSIPTLLSTMTAKVGSLIISVSPNPVAQTIAAGGSSITFANYQFDATQSAEDVRFGSLPLKYAYTGSASSLANCQLFDGSTALNTGSNMVSPYGSASGDNIIFALDQMITVPRGTAKTFALKCNVSSSTIGSYKWGIASSVNVNVVGVTMGNDIPEQIIGSDGQLMSITIIQPAPVAPVVTLSANQIATSDAQPRSYNVAWSATNANSCVLTTNAVKGTEDFDFWSGYIGPVQTSGSITAQVYSGATVTITCTGSGGTAAKSVNLIGNAATSSLTPEMISAMTAFSQQNNLNTANVLRAVEQLMKAFR